MSYNIFVSYSTKDLEQVNLVKKSLNGLPEVKYFIAEYSLKPGQSLGTDVLKAINDCNLFILLWSEEAKNSEWVQMEIGAAKGKSKRILPIIFQSGIELPGFIKDLKYLKFNDPNIDPMKWLRNHILAKSKEKKQNENLALLGIGVLILLALSSD